MFGILFSAFGVIILVAFVVIKKRKNAMASENAIPRNYGTLVELLSESRDVIEEMIGTRTLKIRFLKEKDKQTYQLSEVDGRLIIVWTLESKVHGKRGKEWSFNSTYDQEKMFAEISSDLGQYNKQLFRER
jgi:hypothetical protein